MGNEFQNRCLKHHGIKGQKWGVRRFQNADGSLTTAGVERYRKGTDSKANENQGLIAEAVAFAVPMTLVALSVAVDNAQARRREKRLNQMIDDAEKNSNAKRYEQEREGETLDPESGFYKKNKKMTDQEDMKRINPSFDTDNDAFKTNCTACTVAMELRQRGFDVHAGTDGTSMLKNGGTSAKQRQSWYKDGAEYLQRYLKGGIKIDDDATSEARLQAVEAHAAKTPNSRGEMLVDWLGGAGHSMYYKTDKKGKLTVFDTQTNTAYEGDSLKKILDRSERVITVRTDDLEYDYDVLKKEKMII